MVSVSSDLTISFSIEPRDSRPRWHRRGVRHLGAAGCPFLPSPSSHHTAHRVHRVQWSIPTTHESPITCIRARTATTHPPKKVSAHKQAFSCTGCSATRYFIFLSMIYRRRHLCSSRESGDAPWYVEAEPLVFRISRRQKNEIRAKRRGKQKTTTKTLPKTLRLDFRRELEQAKTKKNSHKAGKTSPGAAPPTSLRFLPLSLSLSSILRRGRANRAPYEPGAR